MIAFWKYGQKRCVIWRMLTFIIKLKWWIHNIFALWCIFDVFLNSWVGFFGGKLTKPYRHIRPFPLVSQQILASISNHHCPPRHPAQSLGHYYTGFTCGSSNQARAIPPPSWGSALSLNTGSLCSFEFASHLQLYRKGVYIDYLWLYSEKTAKRYYFTKANFHQTI